LINTTLTAAISDRVMHQRIAIPYRTPMMSEAVWALSGFIGQWVSGAMNAHRVFGLSWRISVG
jgi:hypothetical protein